MAKNVFVVVPTDSRYGIVIGKNSNRPSAEVQELIYQRANDCEEAGEECPTLPVPVSEKTKDVILSKPACTWGCEMGANSDGLVGGTVALKEDAGTEFTAQIVLRLALERSASSESAADLVGNLWCDIGLADGQAAFLLADKDEAWYVEAVGKAWVAQRVAPGARVYPSAQRIADDYDKAVSNLNDVARAAGWNGEGKVSWRDVFRPAREEDDKQVDAENSIIASHFSDVTNFGVKQMTQVLRDSKNRISRSASDSLPTAASQVSVIPKTGPSCHWFTATPDPALSVFKPFIFTPRARISTYTKSPPAGALATERQHCLYRLHASATASGENKVISLLHDMEANCLNEVDTFMFEGIPGQTLSEVDDLLKDCVEAEMKFYK